MRKWEDIVKEKMEEFDGTLPDSVLAEFHARQSQAAQKPFPWAWALVPAVAAGLAAVLLLHRPSEPETGVQLVQQQPASPVAVATDTVETVQAEPLIAQVIVPKKVNRPIEKAQEVTLKETPQADENVLPEIETEAPSTPEPEQPTEEKVAEMPTGSPFIPENIGPKPRVKMKITPVVGAAAGTGLLAAIVTPILASRTATGETADIESPALETRRAYADLTVYHSGQNLGANEPSEELTGAHSQYSPVKAGLSVGIPLSKRWKLTTGVEYSLYKSSINYTQNSITYTLSGVMQQYAHYVGIPLRMDWSIVSNRWLDVYLGAGMAGDFCVAATLGGEKFQRDGFSFSLLGAGGIQFNFTRHIGLYLEPELSWTVPSDKRVLITYRQEHPFLFTVATGIRINLGK